MTLIGARRSCSVRVFSSIGLPSVLVVGEQLVIGAVPVLALADEAANSGESDESAGHLNVLFTIALVPNPFSLYVIAEVAFFAKGWQEV